MKVRLRAPNGNHVLDFGENATIKTFIEQVRSKSGLDGDLEFRTGYPPKPLEIDASNLSSPLSSLPVKLAGETVVVAQIDKPPSATSSARPADNSRTSSSKTSSAIPSSGPLSNSSGLSFAEEAKAASFSMNRPPGTSAPKRAPKKMRDNSDYELEPPVIPVTTQPGQSLVLRIMEDDNSCLFRAINYIWMRSIDTMQELRALIAQEIQKDATKPNDQQEYSDAVLGMPRDDYCKRIQSPDYWGGGIELAILSKHFDMELWSIDVQTGRVDRFNNGRPTAGIVVYSGIHYDALAMTATPHSSDDDVTVFSSNDEAVMEAASKLVKVLKGRKYFTDTAGFTLVCNTCGDILIGEQGAREHSQQTGHTDFGEKQLE